MSLFTEKERGDLCYLHDNNPGALFDATVAAVLEKLSAGVSVEPDGWRTQEYIGAPSQQEPYYNSDTFTTTIAAARVQENERCAARVDESAQRCQLITGRDIRALLGKEAP